MVEAATATSTSSSSLPPVNHSPPRAMSAETQSYLGLGTAMLLGSAQSCGYFGQKLFNMERSERLQQIQRPHSPPHHTRIHNPPGSLFTIDSILAPKPVMMRNGDSPSSSPPTSANASPIRPTRLPGAMLHHPGIHLGHLAAAAASGFGNTSDFLGKKNF